MGDEQLELNMLGYFNKDWLMEIDIDDVVEEVMRARVFDEIFASLNDII